MGEKTRKRIKNYIPAPALVCYVVFLVGLAVVCLCRLNTSFADLFNRYIGSFFRSVLSYATYIFPCSVAEFLIISFPVLLVLFIFFAMKASKTKKDTGRYIISVFSVAALVFGMLNLNFAPGYYTTPIEYKLGFEKEEIDEEKLYLTAKILLSESNALSKKIDFGYGGGSKLHLSYDELSQKLNESYDSLSEKYSFIPRMKTRLKPVVLSKPLTYTHISGIYTFFTGESNINTNFPDYTLPYVCAHEMAHQRGIAKEDEANFIAFLACLESNDDYIKYSAYMELYAYVASALYQTDEDMYFQLIENMSSEVRNEIIEYSKFFEEYKENTAADISEAVNDTYLKTNGQSEGTRSYDLVVELAVAYYLT